MKIYRRRPNVELLEISGEYLLVATKEARDLCPYVTQINESAAACWKLLDRPMPVGELMDKLVDDCGKENKDVMLPVLVFIQKMTKRGYLVEEDA
jgi:hypothetical protein